MCAHAHTHTHTHTHSHTCKHTRSPRCPVKRHRDTVLVWPLLPGQEPLWKSRPNCPAPPSGYNEKCKWPTGKATSRSSKTFFFFFFFWSNHLNSKKRLLFCSATSFGHYHSSPTSVPSHSWHLSLPQHQWPGIPNCRLRSLQTSPAASQLTTQFERKDLVSFVFIFPASTLPSREKIFKYLVKKKNGRKLGQEWGRKEECQETGRQGKKQKTPNSDSESLCVIASHWLAGWAVSAQSLGPGSSSVDWLGCGPRSQRPSDLYIPVSYCLTEMLIMLVKGRQETPIFSEIFQSQASTTFATSHLCRCHFPPNFVFQEQFSFHNRYEHRNAIA